MLNAKIIKKLRNDIESISNKNFNRLPFDKFDISSFEGFRQIFADLVVHLGQFISGEILEFEDMSEVFTELNQSIECGGIYFVSNSKFCISNSQTTSAKITNTLFNSQNKICHPKHTKKTNKKNTQKKCVILDRNSPINKLIPDCVENPTKSKQQLSSLVEYFKEDFGNLSQTIEILGSMNKNLDAIIKDFQKQFEIINSIIFPMNDLVTILISFFQMTKDQEFSITGKLSVKVNSSLQNVFPHSR